MRLYPEKLTTHLRQQTLPVYFISGDEELLVQELLQGTQLFVNSISWDGVHHVSLDKAIRTMRETGADMKVKYKETARGGLALTVVEC